MLFLFNLKNILAPCTLPSKEDHNTENAPFFVVKIIPSIFAQAPSNCGDFWVTSHQPYLVNLSLLGRQTDLQLITTQLCIIKW